MRPQIQFPETSKEKRREGRKGERGQEEEGGEEEGWEGGKKKDFYNGRQSVRILGFIL